MREEFIYFSNIEEKNPFYIDLAGSSFCDGSYRIERTPSKVCVVEYILSGEGKVVWEGKEYWVKEGDMYLLPPDRDHLYYSDDINPWEKIWFNAGGPLINLLLETYDLQNKIIFPTTNGRSFIEDIHRIGRSAKSNDEKNREAALVFHALLQFLHSNYHSSFEKYSETMFLLKNYIENHIETNFSLQDLSKIVSLSESQVVRNFKRELGTTPYDYLLSLKIEQAKKLLKNSGLMIKEISVQLGFCDEHYFSSLFKKKTGLRPTEYRMRYTKKDTF